MLTKRYIDHNYKKVHASDHSSYAVSAKQWPKLNGRM